MATATKAKARVYVTGPNKVEERDRILTEVAEKERPRLLGLIRSRLRDQIEAEDVFQESFADFIEAYDLGQAIETFGAWLVRDAQNKVIDRFRRRKTREDYRQQTLARTTDPPASGARPDDQWTRTWLRAEIVRALELLPKEQRDVFV